MICDCKNLVVEIVAVEEIQWKEGTFEIEPRTYASLAFRIKGSAKITVGDEVYDTSKNEILYLGQDVAYVAEYDDSEIIVIHFRTQISDKKVEVYAPAQAEELFQEFLKARTLWKMKEAGYEAYVLSRLYGILGRLCKNEMKMQMPEHFANAVSFINGNYANSMLSIDAICKHAGISATNLRLLFQKYYQKTPVEYITELRLEYARSLISCGTSVEQAAEKSGFNDAKYFARVVKKYFHCTPRELRLYGK